MSKKEKNKRAKDLLEFCTNEKDARAMAYTGALYATGVLYRRNRFLAGVFLTDACISGDSFAAYHMCRLLVRSRDPKPPYYSLWVSMASEFTSPGGEGYGLPAPFQECQTALLLLVESLD